MRIRNDMLISVRTVRNPFRYGSDRRRLFATHSQEPQTVGAWINERVLLGEDRDTLTFYLRYASRRGYIELSRYGVPVRATPPAAPYVRPYAPAPVSTPVGSTNYDEFGVEFEFILPAGQSLATVAQRITLAGIDCHFEGYNHFLRPTWKTVTDGSVSAGGEVVSPVLRGEDGMRQVAKVCEVLNEMGCRVNRTCGLHVHVNSRGLGLDYFRRLVALYATNEDILDSIQPPSRRNNYFCGTVKNYMRVADDCHPDHASRMIPGRYRKVNLEAYRRHRTVEFRQHSGTIDGEKACAWVRLCLAMTAFARGTEVVPVAGNLESFLCALNVSAEDRAYFETRRARIAAVQQRRAA